MRILCFILLLFSLQPELGAQEQTAFTDTIPYTIVEGKMVIPAQVNGITTHFIYDSGGQNIMMIDSAISRGVKATGGASMTSDMNRKINSLRNGQVARVVIGKNHILKNMKMMLMGNTKSFSSLGVSGILGGQAFSNAVVSLLPRQRLMVLNYPYRPKNLKRSDALTIRSDEVFHPFIQVPVGQISIEALFDTGVEDLMMLSGKDFQVLKQQQSLKPVDSAYGTIYVGVNGVGNPSVMYKLNLPSIKVAEKVFNNVGTITTQMGTSIVGLELLKYGDLTIDYPRNGFYFQPFEAKPSHLSGAPQTWNVDILPIVDHFQISNIWKTAKDLVKLGERVSNINGISLEGLPLSQPLIMKMMQEITQNSAYLMVGPKGKERKVMIKKE